MSVPTIRRAMHIAAFTKARIMSKPVDETHIGMFDVQECKDLIAGLRLLPNNTNHFSSYEEQIRRHMLQVRADREAGRGILRAPASGLEGTARGLHR